MNLRISSTSVAYAALAAAVLTLVAALHAAFGSAASQAALLILAVAVMEIGRRRVLRHYARRTGKIDKYVPFWELTLEEKLQLLPFAAIFFALGFAAMFIGAA